MTLSDLKNAIAKQRDKNQHNGQVEKSDMGIQETSTGMGHDQVFVLKVVVIVLTCFCVSLLTAVLVLGITYGTSSECERGPPVIPKNVENPGIFDELTIREMQNIHEYMISRPDLHIVTHSKAQINDSYIYAIDLHIPLKAAVLRKLDRGDKIPERTAKVIVFRGDLEPPRVEEYHVGPLPNPEYYRLVQNPSYTTPRISFSARPVSIIEYRILDDILTRVSEELYYVLFDSYGLSYHNCTDSLSCITYRDTAPRGLTSGERKTWFTAFRDVDGYYLHPLGLEIQIDHKSVNTSNWVVTQIFYNNRIFTTSSELILYYQTGHVNKISLSPSTVKDYEFSSYNRRGKNGQKEPLQGPKLVETDGRRFQVTGNHIKYMHWDFDIHMRMSTGLQLFDIRFQEERIIYELSLQEAVVFYSGFSPVQSSSAHYATSMYMGRLNYELVPGVDCPDTAVFQDMNFFVDTDKPMHYKNVLCIFEENGGMPLRRHFSSNKYGKFKQYGGIVNYYLVVRTITSVWNYDLIFDYIFYQSGAVEVKVSKTGYVSSTFRLIREQKYGYPLREDVSANIHQNLFHYKIDLDINGKINKFASLDFGAKLVDDVWNKDRKRATLTFEKNDREREQDILFEERFTNTKYDIIYNERATSKFGSQRAYRIHNLAVMENILNNAMIANAARWAKYPIAVSQHNEAEEMSTSIYAQNDPWDPVVDFDRFLQNNDSIVNQDLVAWVTMGSVHIPHTEDVPSISTPGKQHSFYILPFNYFTECPSVSSSNVVQISPKGSGEVNVNTHGTSFESTCVQHPVGPFDYSGHQMTINIP